MLLANLNSLKPYDLLKYADYLPESVRTLRRARTLLLLSRHEPTTNHHIAHQGEHPLNSVRKLMREYIDDELVYEIHHLYRLTSKGRRILADLLKDPYLIQWMEEEIKEKELSMERPTITKIQ